MTEEEIKIAFDLAESGKLFELSEAQIEKFFSDEGFKIRLYAAYRAMDDLRYMMDNEAVHG